MTYLKAFRAFKLKHGLGAKEQRIEFGNTVYALDYRPEPRIEAVGQVGGILEIVRIEDQSITMRLGRCNERGSIHYGERSMELFRDLSGNRLFGAREVVNPDVVKVLGEEEINRKRVPTYWLNDPDQVWFEAEDPRRALALNLQERYHVGGILLQIGLCLETPRLMPPHGLFLPTLRCAMDPGEV